MANHSFDRKQARTWSRIIRHAKPNRKPRRSYQWRGAEAYRRQVNGDK